jgi:hypothetical protein
MYKKFFRMRQKNEWYIQQAFNTFYFLNAEKIPRKIRAERHRNQFCQVRKKFQKVNIVVIKRRSSHYNNRQIDMHFQNVRNTANSNNELFQIFSIVHQINDNFIWASLSANGSIVDAGYNLSHEGFKGNQLFLRRSFW